MILSLVAKDHSLLKTKLEPFDFANPPTEPNQLARDLAETMLSNNGVGLAANQCGLPYRVFVIKSAPILCCFNPKVVDVSSQEVYLEEGCLTFPGVFYKIKRPRKIKVRFTQPNGETVTRVFEGITARIFQHELDHLDGILYQSRVSLFHKEQAERRAKKGVGFKQNLDRDDFFLKAMELMNVKN